MHSERHSCLPRIHKVLMENFLSFSRQEVELDPQFSVIVGPNGSGKSSIFQAVKFALGSNDKDSRYPRWSDFIRFGEQYARVELDIVQGEESHSIRRTVFQNGKITYEMKTPMSPDFEVVQKNVTDDLTAGLGYSTDNIFAFVSQGKIDAIKSMDPHGLCTYLEEGLGILPLRQKIEYENDRLLHLQQDLGELGQRKSTYEMELDFLHPKLERLVRKRVILGDLTRLKEELMIANRQKIISDIETLKEEKSKNIESLAKIEEKLAQAQEQEDRFSQAIEVLEGELNGLFEQTGRSKADLALIDGEIKAWEREKQEKVEILRAMDVSLRQIEENFNQKQQIENKIREKLDNTSHLAEEMHAKHTMLVGERERITKALRSHADWQEKYVHIKAELEEKEKRLTGLTEKIDSLRTQSTKLLEKISYANHQCDRIYKILEKWGENFEKNFQGFRSKLRKEIFNKEGNLHDLRAQKNKCLEDLSRFEQVIAGKDSVYPPEVRQIKAEIARRNWAVQGPLIELMHFDPLYARAIESIFGKAALYSFIAPNRETFLLLTQLRKNLHAFCKIFLPKSLAVTPFSPLPKQEGVVGYLFDLINVGSDEDVRKVIRAIVSDAIVIEHTSVGLDLHNATVKARCVTLDGEILIPHKYAEESRPPKDLRDHLSIQQIKLKADQCQKQISQIEGELARESSELQILKEKFDQLEKIGQLLPKLQELCTQKEEYSNENHAINAEKAILEEEQEKTKNSIASLQQDLKTMEQRVGVDVLRMQERGRDLPSEIEICLNDLNSLLKVKEATAQDFQVASQTAATTCEELENCQLKKRQISEEIEKNDDQILTKFNELRKSEKEIAKLEKKIEETKNRKSLVIQDKKVCEDQYFTLKLESDRFHLEINRVEDLITELEQGLRKIMEQLTNRPLQDQEPARPVEEIHEEIAHITELLAEFIDVDDYIEARRDEILESIKRVQDHRGQIGEEILAAEKVIEALQSEFFAKLTFVLGELEKRMNERFQNHAVNYRVALELKGEFSHLEVRITAGILTNPLTPITALSGGQRTMVAINLVLSLQNFNPSPIIIFDEAEMFLDKKNSAVVSKLVGETTNNGVQIIMLMPDSSKGLITLANRVIGVALAGPNGPSTIIPDPHLLNMPPPEE